MAAKKKAAKKAVKKTAKKKTVKKAAKKKTASKRKPSAAFMKPMKISAALGAVIGAGPYPRTEVTKKLWAYIKRNGPAGHQEPPRHQRRRQAQGRCSVGGARSTCSR